MKIKVMCDSGANIHSCRTEIIDVEKDWGITDEDWNSFTDEEKFNLVKEWAEQRLSIDWEEM